MSGTLYLVATPIGNWDDMTFRALRILKEVEVVVYEEHREGRKLLAHFGISDKITQSLNEHNDEEASVEIIQYLNSGKNVALISDAGTPVLSDPGQSLIRKAIDKNIQMIPVPGASSISPALILSGFPIGEFLFYGFLSPKNEIRLRELRTLREEKRTIAFMETPYRLTTLLKDMSEVLNRDRQVCIAFNLTMPDEQIFRGKLGEIYQKFEENKIKGEFVVVLEGEQRKRMKIEV